MKFKILLLFVFIQTVANAQSGTWVWMKGDSTYNPAGSYGIQNVPDTNNMPPALDEPAFWTDLEGNFWLFGGVYLAERYAALWKFTPATNTWTWVKGPSTYDAQSVYGTIGQPAATNMPGSIFGWPTTWTDHFGDLWMMGSFTVGADGVGASGMHMWKYHIATNEWTWMNGPTTNNFLGNHGTLGVESATNLPRQRLEAKAAWVDNDNNLWFYGGSEYPGAASNALWRYNTTTNMWTCFNHTNPVSNADPVYGTQFVESYNNWPGARSVFCYYYDRVNNYVWLIGGGSQYSKYNDVWRYNMNTHMWAWMGGESGVNNIGTTNTYCQPGSIPSARYINNVLWSDNCGHLSFYGGGTVHDYGAGLWMFDVNTIDFKRLTGQDSILQLANYGALRVPAATNHPPSLFGTMGFVDTDNNMWMFGGETKTLGYQKRYLNAMWKYIPDSCSYIPHNINPTLNYTEPTTNCATYPIQYNITGVNNANLLYGWDFGDMGEADTSHLPNPVYNYSHAGSYTIRVNVTDTTDGCNNSVLRFLNIDVPEIISLQQFPDTILCPNSSISIGYPSPYTTLWNTGDTTDVITIDEDGIYWKMITTGNCTIYDTISVVYDNCLNLTENTRLNFTLYPNPTAGNAVIAFNDSPAHPYTIQLYSIDGRLLSSTQTKEKHYTLTLDGFADGLYFVRVSQNNLTSTQKLCVAR